MPVAPRPLPFPLPPEHLRFGVGDPDGEFYRVGEDIVARVKREAGLNPASRVLDIGCGLGRVAWPLGRELGPEGSYDGFDTMKQYIEWCENGLALDPQRMRFHWFNIYNSVYNPAGTLDGENLVFPWPDGAFTLAIATSLFTHLAADGTANYVREIARTLERGGRVFASFFVIDNESREIMAQRETYPHFTDEIEHGRIADPDSPDVAIAFNAEWLHQVFLSCGFAIEVYKQGRWRDFVEKKDELYQDLVVAVKQ
ncbi:MAG TPA: class I SAM-dependent methyltransferase [Thermoanaerobaculia bacterium]|nr:class I SAM-dependent methyltransferase [Thermoanaerobaculia bacterium]